MAVSTTWVVIACIVLGGLIWFSFFHFYDVGFGELIVRKNKKSSGSGVLYRRDFVRTDIIKPTNIEFLKSNPRSYIPRNETVLKVSEVVKLYDDEENKLSEAAIVWAEFILIPKVRLRSRQQSLDPSVLKTFHLCSNEVVANLSRKLDGKDFEFCKWSNSRTGGKVKVHISSSHR